MGIQMAALEVCGFGEGAGIDVDYGGSDSLGDLDELVGLDRRVDDLKGRGIAAVARSFLSAHSVSCERAADQGGRDGGENKERRCETIRAQACKKGFHRFEDLLTGSANKAGKIRSAKFKYSESELFL
jgi:hypothetical protein